MRRPEAPRTFACERSIGRHRDRLRARWRLSLIFAGMRQRLLKWQWSLYPAAHRARRNLIVHIATVPVFMLGTLALAFVWRWPWLGLAGLVTMVLVMAVQGRGHRIEEVAPVPFTGPLDGKTSPGPVPRVGQAATGICCASIS